jgi:hypothetical protein
MELHRVRFSSADALETSDQALTIAKGDMVFGARTADIGPEQCGGFIRISSDGREVEHTSPELRIFKSGDFPEAPERSLGRMQGKRRRAGGDGAAAH